MACSHEGKLYQEQPHPWWSTGSVRRRNQTAVSKRAPGTPPLGGGRDGLPGSPHEGRAAASGRVLDPQRAAESAGRVVRFSSVVADENRSVAKIPEDGAAELPDSRRRPQPAGRLRIELPDFLQPTIQLLREQLRAHLRSQLHGAALRLVLLPRLERLLIVAEASPASRALLRAADEEVLVRFAVVFDHIRLAPGALHLRERPELRGTGLEPGLHVGPVDARVTVPVSFETEPERFQKLLPLTGVELLRRGFTGHRSPQSSSRSQYLHSREPGRPLHSGPPRTSLTCPPTTRQAPSSCAHTRVYR